VMYAVDRSGRLSAVRTDTGIEIWSKVTGDLSGLLPTPVLWRDRVVLTSLDGPLRCLLQANVRQIWEIPAVPCEWAPGLVDHVLVAGTTEGALLGIDLATDGKVSYRTTLPGAISSDVQVHGDRVVVTTADGWVVCAEGKTGRIAWKFEVGSGVVAAPAVSDDLVVVGGTDGRLVALRATSGEKVWETFGLGEVLYAPVFAAGRVVVATGDRLLAFDLGRGQQRAIYQGAAPWSASPVIAGDNILVGDRRGVVTVVGASALDLRYQLHGESAVAGPVTVTPDGKFVVGFENRSVRCYTPP